MTRFRKTFLVLAIGLSAIIVVLMFEYTFGDHPAIKECADRIAAGGPRSIAAHGGNPTAYCRRLVRPIIENAKIDAAQKKFDEAKQKASSK